MFRHEHYLLCLAQFAGSLLLVLNTVDAMTPNPVLPKKEKGVVTMAGQVSLWKQLVFS